MKFTCETKLLSKACQTVARATATRASVPALEGKESFFRTDIQNSTVHPVTKLFVNTAAALDYSGYSEEGEFKPNSKDTPVIHLSGTRKLMTATL